MGQQKDAKHRKQKTNKKLVVLSPDIIVTLNVNNPSTSVKRLLERLEN